jgi:hypothetical protein
MIRHTLNLTTHSGPPVLHSHPDLRGDLAPIRRQLPRSLDMAMTEGYYTLGDIRGDCGHLHQTIADVIACRRRDQEYCSLWGGTSDRQVCRADGEPLTAADLLEAAD